MVSGHIGLHHHHLVVCDDGKQTITFLLGNNLVNTDLPCYYLKLVRAEPSTLTRSLGSHGNYNLPTWLWYLRQEPFDETGLIPHRFRQ